jgi:hypothetical protein
MSLYDSVADIPFRVEESDRRRRERDTSSGFLRVTTTVELSGAGETGRGEDVSYDAEDHDGFAAAAPLTDPDGFDLAGEWTLDSFSAALDDRDLFPTRPPERETAEHYRRWAIESAALDLALRQADASLGDVLDRSYDPVRFVVSTRLDGGDPGRVRDVSGDYPGTEFKLDPTGEWTSHTFAALSEFPVRVLDLKGQYEGTEVDADADPDLYERVFETFPTAVVEDPRVTPETRMLVASYADRLSWDVPITGVESVRELPFDPEWLNVKPSRFGTVESLLDTVEYAEAEGIDLYGGGQFELGVGRDQIQRLAALFYPDGPNDVAPGGYNDPDVPDGLPRSPLDVHADRGL